MKYDPFLSILRDIKVVLLVLNLPSFCSSFNALSIVINAINIGVCCQEISSLDFNFHCWYSRHSISFLETTVTNVLWSLTPHI